MTHMRHSNKIDKTIQNGGLFKKGIEFVGEFMNDK